MIWMIPSWALALLVYLSLIVSAVAPVVLIVLLVKDYKRGKLW